MESGSLALPEAGLLRMQAEWLAPARAQLLRQVGVGRRREVLDLGTGYGAVVPELVRRSRGPVVALDRVFHALARGEDFRGAERVAGDAVTLPFASASFDLVFSHLTLLWVAPLTPAIDEVARVLRVGGALVALEPDYGGMIEYPFEVATRDLWVKGLARAGADPYIGRKLPGLLARAGFEVRVSLFDTLFEPSVTRFAFLHDLPLLGEERAELERVEGAAGARGPWAEVAHLPFMLVTAVKREDE